MANSIVTVNVSTTVAPTPPTLQSSGAMISQGSTNLGAGDFSLLTQASDLTALLNAAAAITSLAWNTNVVTATTTAPHGIPNEHAVAVTISGATPTAYNGTFLATSTGTSTFTYPLVGDPGSETVPGFWVLASTSDLVNAVAEFFEQGSRQGVYVLELGEGDAAEGVTALAAYITANPNSAYAPGAQGYFYAYLVPKLWSSESTFVTFCNGFNSATAKTYFFVTMTTGNYTSFSDLQKCVVGLVEAPTGAPSTEFSIASAFWVALAYAPSSTNKVTPYAFSFLFAVTAWLTKGNNTTLAALRAASVNVVGTGAEGGISNTILLWGTTMDGRGFTYWYSVDAIQINIDVDISNAVINGSNDPLNPLYYNQDGINRLQAVGAATLANMVSYGLALGTVAQTQLAQADFINALESGAYAGKLVINAEPFLTYSAENPGDYKIGKYGGFSIAYVTQNGFINIVFDINVSDFVAQQ